MAGDGDVDGKVERDDDGKVERDDDGKVERDDGHRAAASGRSVLASLRSWQQRRMEDHPHASIRKGHPRFVEAVIEDARVAADFRGERSAFRGRADAIGQALRLALVSDAFGAQMCYRAKARWQQLGIPVLPRIAHRLAMASAQICIGDPVVLEPGVYFPHGQVVIDGITVVGTSVAVRPWVTIGLKEGDFNGPIIEPYVQIGTGAKIVGPVRIGQGSLIGANAVVLDDVPARSVAVGVPAKILDKPARPLGGG
jgi:serine O-acetyltransferase